MPQRQKVSSTTTLSTVYIRNCYSQRRLDRFHTCFLLCCTKPSICSAVLTGFGCYRRRQPALQKYSPLLTLMTSLGLLLCCPLDLMKTSMWFKGGPMIQNWQIFQLPLSLLFPGYLKNILLNWLSDQFCGWGRRMWVQFCLQQSSRVSWSELVVHSFKTDFLLC